MANQYTDAQLYTQLRYYASLFDIESGSKKASAAKQGAQLFLLNGVVMVADVFAFVPNV